MPTSTTSPPLSSTGPHPSARGPGPGAAAPDRSRVVLVGAGIVNLMTAHWLVRAGFDVTLVDRVEDPRRAPAPWSESATHGGSDARMYTLIEGDVLAASAPAAGGERLRARVSAGGWLLDDAGAATERERAFLAEREHLPAWLAESLGEDIHALTRRSGELWHELMHAQPALFEGAGLCRGVLRLFGDAAAMERARALHESLGEPARALAPDQVSALEPALADAVARGALAGGLAVPGFTVNIHALVARVLGELESRGARLVWRQEVRGVVRDADGRARGLDLAGAAPLLAADHYVLSPGALPGPLLAGTQADAAIQGLAGVFLSVPNLEPQLRTSVKLQPGARPEHVNITPARDAGQPILVVSAGYAFTGERAPALDHPELAVLFDRLEDHARRLVPAAHAQAEASGALRASRRACIRPWTARGIGVLAVEGTAAGGKLVITGGHGTAGFAQAMAVAEAVEAALAGTPHLMHAALHPARGRFAR